MKGTPAAASRGFLGGWCPGIRASGWRQPESTVQTAFTPVWADRVPPWTERQRL